MRQNETESRGCVTVEYSQAEKQRLYDTQATQLNSSPAFQRLVERFIR